MLQGLTGWHFLIILVIILLLFGAPKLPALARSLGQSMKILKTEVRDKDADASSETTNESVADGTAKPGATPTSKPGADSTPGT